MVNENGGSRKKEIHLSIIVPVYNETKRIHNLKTIVEYCNSKSNIYEIIVVDDGSNDETASKSAEILKEYKNSKILVSDKNYGKGHAVATGMKEASGEYHLFMDVDLSTPLTHIDDALREIKSHDIVIGTRKNGKASLIKRQPWLRENLGKAFTFLSSVVLNTWLSDFTCGFKLFTREASKKIFAASRIQRWAFDSEILFLARKMNFSISELPVNWKNDEDTRVNLRKVILPTLFDIFRIRFGNYADDSKVVDEITETDSVEPAPFFQQRVSNNNSIIILLVFFFLLRILFFIKTQDAGMEHDSAWYLGVAKNLAQSGKYASYTNTSTDSRTVSPSIHRRINVQDKNGMVYFPAGVTVGPMYVVPQALLMKVFGFGFWQYRLWPILGYVMLLSLLFYMALWLGGKISLFTFAAILWIRPDFFINYAFEAYSEHIALFFVLLSALVLHKSLNFADRRNRLLIAGMIFGASILTKNLSFIFLPGLLIQLLPAKFFSFKGWITTIRNTLSFLMGVIFLISIYVLYAYAYMTMKFGKIGFFAVVEDFILTWKMGGGGFGVLNSNFIFEKIRVFNNIGHANIILFLIVLFLIPSFISKFWKEKTHVKFILSLQMMFLTNYLWFSMISQTGWLRHIWMAIVVFMLLLSLVFSKITESRIHKSGWVFYLLALAIIMFSIVINENSNPAILIDKKYVTKLWARSFLKVTANKNQSFVFSPVFSWKDLVEITKFLNGSEYKSQRLYFAGTFLVTEVATETMRPIYSLARIIEDKQDGLLIIGPYQKGELTLLGKDYEGALAKSYCNDIFFKNPSYMICTVKMTKFDIGKK